MLAPHSVMDTVIRMEAIRRELLFFFFMEVFMSKKLLSLGGGLVLALSLSSASVLAQDTATKTTTTTTTTARTTVQNPDGSYTVIEYPVGKEVTVDLTPNNLTGAKGIAHVRRSANGTNVALDLSGLPA